MPAEPTYRDLLRAYARKYKVPEDLAFAVLTQESGGTHQPAGGDLTTSSKGAQGFMQLLPSTAKGEFGLDSTIPEQNLEAGVRYLRQGMDRTVDRPGAVARTRDVLAYYHGGPNKAIHGPITQAYVDQAMKRLQAMPAPTPDPEAPPTSVMWQGPGAVPDPAAPPAPPPTPSLLGGPKAAMRAPTFAEAHPFLGSYDPRNPTGRRNLAVMPASMAGSAIGGVVGGIGSGLLSAPSPATIFPAVSRGEIWGSKVGSSIGAGLAGAGMQALEETGIFGPPPTPPPADSTALGRIARTGATEAAWDVGGQALFAPVRAFARAGLQSTVAKHARQSFRDSTQKVLKPLYDGLSTLRTATRQLRLDRNAIETSTREAADLATKNAEAAAAVRVADVKTAEGAKVRDVVKSTRATVAGLQEAERVAAEARHQAGLAATERRIRAQELGQEGIAHAEKLGEQRVAGTEAQMAARQAEQTPGWQSQVGLPPSEALAGRATAEVIEGPATQARRALGQAVDDAAETGPDVDIGALQDEVRDIVQRELLPPASTFPSDIPPGAGNAPSPEALALRLQGVSDAQWDELKKTPAMGIIVRLLNAPSIARFADVHQWKSQLGQALNARGALDRVVSPQLDNLSEKIMGGLRGALGTAKHAAYETATAEYEKVAPLFTKGFADLVKRTAVDSPEKLVQAISPDDPTSTRMMVQLLTEQAAAGGGKQAGESALAQVQHAWLYRNVLNGDLATLGERLTKLRAKPNWPDFEGSFLGDDTGKRALANAQLLADEIDKEFRYQAARIAASKTGGKEAVERAAVAADTSKKLGRAVSLNEIREARLAVQNASAATRAAKAAKLEELEAARAARQAAIDQAKATGRREVGEVAERGGAEVTAARRETKEALAAQDVKKQGLQERVRAGRAITPDEQTFRESTLSPSAMRTARQATRDRIMQGLRAAVIAAGGYAALGKLGAFAGVVGLGSMKAAASEADMLRYMIASPGGVQWLVENLATTRRPSLSVGGAAVLKGGYNWATTEPPAPPDTEWWNMEQVR